jgi:sulfide:quinone oxidoreductase
MTPVGGATAGDRRRVVIAGGGVAAVEAALALRDLAGDRVALTLVSGSPDFVYRPFAVVRPFHPQPPYRLALEQIAVDLGAALVIDTAVGIEPEQDRLVLQTGEPVGYDAVLIAIGAGAAATYGGGTITPWDWGGGHAFRAMLGALREGRTKSVTFVVPKGIVWALPLYELALLVSAYLMEEAIGDVTLTLVTVERAPLEVFGSESSAKVAELLRARGIAVLLETETHDVEDGLVRTADGAAISSDATVAVPVIRPHPFSGVALDEKGFIVVDEHCRVGEKGNVFAAGDCTAQPHKQGGVAAQQADAAAAGIAALVGAPVEATPVRRELHALLFTGEESLPLGSAGSARGEEPSAKIDARYLTPYLRAAHPSLPRLTG